MVASSRRVFLRLALLAEGTAQVLRALKEMDTETVGSTSLGKILFLAVLPLLSFAAAVVPVKATVTSNEPLSISSLSYRKLEIN